MSQAARDYGTGVYGEGIYGEITNFGNDQSPFYPSAHKDSRGGGKERLDLYFLPKGVK